MIRQMVEQPPSGLYLFQIIFIAAIPLFGVALPPIVTYILMARLAPSWWKSRYLTTRLFLVALVPFALIWLGVWVLQPARRGSGDVSLMWVGPLLILPSLFLPVVLGFVALVRWLVGIVFAFER
jgi:hypothetical protein